MKRIFVGNLGFNAQEDEIRRLFEPHGAVESVSIATDWETGHSRGFAFVEMEDAGEADKAAAALSGASLDGRPLAVRAATPSVPEGFKALCFDR